MLPHDPVPGNIGLVGPATILLHFQEIVGSRFVDSAGNLEDLTEGTTGRSFPAHADAWAGKGAGLNGADEGLMAADQPAGDTLITRDCSVQAIVSVVVSDLAGPATLICRGTDGSAAEYYAYGVEVEDAGGGALDVRWFWQDSSGVVQTQAAGTFAHEGDVAFFLLTATRRWEAPDRVVIRYYVDERLIAEHVSTDGDIAGGTTGTTSVGIRRTGGVWGRIWSGVIDELKVVDYEMSAEEVRQTFRRLAVHQPAGVDMVSGHVPPGLSWAADLGNRIGGRVKAAGQAMGFAIAKAEELRETWLPHRAYADGLATWERIRGISARPRESLDVRRARVTALFQREHGYSPPAIRVALEEPFGLDAEDVEILEFTNDVADSFATLDTQRWHVESPTQWSISVGRLRLQIASASDIRWDATTRIPCHVRTPLASNEGTFSAQVKVDTIANITTDAIVGLFLYSFRTGNALWFGIRNDAGTYRLMYRSYLDGVSSEDVLHDYAALPAPVWLRVVAGDTPGTYLFQHSLVSAAELATVDTVAGLIAEPEYAGLAAVGSDASTASLTDVRFDDFLARTPQGDRPFRWYAYRETALGGGEIDMRGAQQIVQKVKPTHTHAAAITSKSLLCDNGGSLCDRGPMGAL